MYRVIGDVEDLLAAMEHAAQAEVRKVEQQAREQADAIRRDAERQAEEARRRVLEEARERAKQLVRARRTESRREARRTYLEAREELLSEVWEQARRRLRAGIEDAGTYADTLERLAVAGARAAGPGRYVLASDATGHELLTEERLRTWARAASEAVQGRVTFERRERPIDSWGGLLATSTDGRQRVDMSFSTRLDLAYEETREAVLERLVRT